MTEYEIRYHDEFGSIVKTRITKAKSENEALKKVVKKIPKDETISIVPIGTRQMERLK